MNELTQKDTNQIIDMYKQNISMDDIIECMGIEENSIRAILKENKVDRTYGRFSEELRNRIVQLYLKGYTQKYISDTLLVSLEGIKKTLKRKGIQRRSYSECNRRYKRNQHYFDKIDIPNKAYILGLLYADGNNHTEHNTITISLQEEDVALLRAIKDELEYEGAAKIKSAPFSKSKS